jgi:hypothetical protein
MCFVWYNTYTLNFTRQLRYLIGFVIETKQIIGMTFQHDMLKNITSTQGFIRRRNNNTHSFQCPVVLSASVIPIMTHIFVVLFSLILGLWNVSNIRSIWWFVQIFKQIGQVVQNFKQAKSHGVTYIKVYISFHIWNRHLSSRDAYRNVLCKCVALSV